MRTLQFYNSNWNTIKFWNMLIIYWFTLIETFSVVFGTPWLYLQNSFFAYSWPKIFRFPTNTFPFKREGNWTNWISGFNFSNGGWKLKIATKLFNQPASEKSRLSVRRETKPLPKHFQLNMAECSCICL